MTSIEYLKSNADFIVYTYGVGKSQTQATPPYLLELADKNPQKKYSLIHCDPSFVFDPTTHFSPCLNQQEWEYVRSEDQMTQYRNRKFENLSAMLIQDNFPFCNEFSAHLTDRLDQGSEIFLGVHATSWTDLQNVMGMSYNKLREKYAGRIHLYIQAGKYPAAVYKGAYSPLFGLSLETIAWDHPEDWVALQRVFSQSNPSSRDVQKVRQAFRHYLEERRQFLKQRPLQLRSTPQLDNPSILPFEDRHGEDLLAIQQASDGDLYKYVDAPLHNRVILIPLKQLSAQMWGSPPGQEIFPNQIALDGEDRALDQRNRRYRTYCTIALPLIAGAMLGYARFSV